MRVVLKKIISAAVVCFTLANFCSCSFNKFDEEKIVKNMEETLTRLFNSIQERDYETFESFFADHVTSQSDFNIGCSYVFDKYKGDLVNVSFHSSGSAGTHFVQREQICYAYMTFIVITSEEEYLACVEFYTQYVSKYPNNSYKIRKFSLLTKQDDENFEDDGIGFSQRYGIYYPGWICEEGK